MKDKIIEILDRYANIGDYGVNVIKKYNHTDIADEILELIGDLLYNTKAAAFEDGMNKGHRLGVKHAEERQSASEEQ